MSKPTATLDDIRQNTGLPVEPYSASAPPTHRGSMKFAYVSGSRPLDGYTLKRGIGRGGFGEVYFAVSDAGKEVAVKKIERNLDIELRGVIQCLNLRHVNLVELYDIKYDDHEEPWVVMEYIAGAVLKDILDANPRGLPTDEVHDWFRGIAGGLAYLHDHGIVHRDLKPANIFDDDGTVKIGDYGLSKYISCTRGSGHTESVGTCHYMAPEIGRGDYGKEIDIYALGIVLFELLTGTVPFDGESSQEVLMKHLTAVPELGGLPDRYRLLVAKALQKDPQQRYSSIESFVAEFEMAVSAQINNVAPLKSHEAVFDPVIVGESVVSPTMPTSAGKQNPTTAARPEPIYIGDGAVDEPKEIQLGPVKQGPGRIVNSRSGLGQQARHGSPFIKPKSTGSNIREKSVPRPNFSNSRSPTPGSAKRWLQQAPGGTALKLSIALALFIVLGITFYLFPRLVPVAAVGGVLVLGLGTALHLGRKRTSTGAGSQNSNGTSSPFMAAGTQDERIQRWGLRQQTNGDRLAELSSSFLAATLVATVLCMIMAALTGRLESTPTLLAFQGWLIVSSTAAAWMLLAAGKFWENDNGEPWKRRFVLLVMGLVFGTFCWGLNHVLLVSMTDELQLSSLLGGLLPASLRSANDTPTLAAYWLYFAVTFALVPWWQHTDPTRESRMSVGAVLLVACASLIFPFPQPWGLTIAVASAVATQLAARWLSPEQRLEVEQRWKQTQG